MSRFYEIAKEHFVFLQRYGYTCLQVGYEDSVSLVGKNNCINISFSAIEYELTCQFIDNAKNTFTLQDALKYVDLKEFKGVYQISRREEIEKGIIYLANAVQRLFDEINISDADNFEIILRYRINMQQELLKDYYFQVDINRAEIYWRKEKYLQAQELYEKHINNLSKKQRKKLEYIKKKLKDSNSCTKN